MQKTVLSSILLLAGLAACDEIDSDLERAAVGAAAGCVAGEVLIGGECVEGAVVGGAVGAVADEF